MASNSTIGLRVLFNWVLLCVGGFALIWALRYYPPLRIHAPAAALGVASGLVGWLCALAWRGHHLDTTALVCLTAVVGVASYLLRRPLVEMTLASPLALVFGAVATFAYCFTGMRNHERSKLDGANY